MLQISILSLKFVWKMIKIRQIVPRYMWNVWVSVKSFLSLGKIEKR